MNARPTQDMGRILAILAVEAHIPPWQARQNLTYTDVQHILDYLAEKHSN